MATANFTSVVHLHKNPYDILIDRTTPWGNPFTHISDRSTAAHYLVASRRDAIEQFEKWAFYSNDPEAVWIRKHVHELQGKTLGCWCRPDRPCHGEVLAVMADRTPPETIFIPPTQMDQLTIF